MEYYNKNKFANLPKKPVKSFLDLEVYQKALEANVFVANTVARAFYSQASKVKKTKNASMGVVYEVKEIIIKIMLNCACGLPHLIAEAHSYRFGSQQTCLILLEKAMLNCNKMVVYLEQTRDICETGLEWEKFDETIKKYMYIRRKVLNLQRSWKKYMQQDSQN